MKRLFVALGSLGCFGCGSTILLIIAGIVVISAINSINEPPTTIPATIDYDTVIADIVNAIIYPDVSEPSATFDCDDSTLAMYQHFTELGIWAQPVIGNLSLNNETVEKCNHIWLWVLWEDDVILAYDWGEPVTDKQHYQGYPVSYEFLLLAVGAD